MKALVAIAALFASVTAFAYSSSPGTVQVIQNNEVYHDVVIHGDAAKAIYNDLRAEEVPNYNDNAPGFSKSGKNVTCDVLGINYYCTIAIVRATGAAM